jgi:hypothetical protein
MIFAKVECLTDLLKQKCQCYDTLLEYEKQQFLKERASEY